MNNMDPNAMYGLSRKTAHTNSHRQRKHKQHKFNEHNEPAVQC